MNNKIYSLKNKLVFIILMLLGLQTQAQNTPFNCDYSAYLFQHNDVYAIDLASGNSYQVAEDITPGNINATAYNPADGFIWGSLSSPEKTIVRIGNDFQTTSFYIDELPSSNRYVGDVSADGVYYLKAGGSIYYKIDLNPESENYGNFISTATLSQNLSIHDWAFNAVDGNIYAIERISNILYRINPENGVVTTLGVVPILSGLSYTYGAVYFDADGRFYVSANQTGTIYVIQSVQDLNGVNVIDSNLFAFGPSSSSNDGARCPTAPVLQEICDNGIDDDGDGLIDCEDPSCSGFGLCPVVQEVSSTANDGGLESNGRLSESINKRNYNRVKNSYKFNPDTAKRVSVNSQTNFRAMDAGFQLEDFVPLNAINEDYAIDSTPEDLLNITNATEVYSVDYVKGDLSIASILALKTENGVYEHTKYICDRLLGAELISVSTIDINEQPFIKSIIKNIDGSYEYVLSLSAKEANEGTNFIIESHWNLDLYQANTTYYNFQIWTNSIDDLYQLGTQVLNLLNTEKTISGYDNSTPPTVFVRKGFYNSGILDLQIINTNATQAVTFDAGYRTTETEAFNNISTTITLGGNYITNLEVETGYLFDIGFRIGDGIHTPDDLFMSDGPWGVDDAQPNTIVSNYEVFENDYDFDIDDFPIERNLDLTATTNTYFAAYRALTPRFKAVDVSDYNSFKLRARGTGNLEITFVKESISNWEDQFKKVITLTDTYQDFDIPLDSFTSQSTSELEVNDIVTIVFTMVSEDGTAVTKTMNLRDISFSQRNALSINDLEAETVEHTLTAYPNPMVSGTTVNFTAAQSTTIEVVIFDQLGKLVYQTSITSQVGNNQIKLNRKGLSSGLYFCKLLGGNTQYNPLKILVK